MVTTISIGRHHSLLRNDFGFIAPGQLRGCTYNRVTSHVWVWAIRCWAGKYTVASNNNVTARLAAYAVDGSMNPAGRLGYSGAFTVSNEMTFAGQGQQHGNDVAVVDVAPPDGVTFDAIPIPSGTRPHFAVLGTSGYLGFGMAEAADIAMDNERFYSRMGLSQPPPSPFGGYVSSIEGHMVIWGVADINEAPEVPTGLSPSGTINDTVPTFTAAFSDENSARGDYLNQFQVQVRRKSDGAILWNVTLSSNATERTAEAFERSYGGSTLTRGVEYEWRTRMSDHFGQYSDWTAWVTFAIANLGFVTVNAAPSGKIETRTPDFQGRWTHQGNQDMTHAQVRLLNADGSIILQTGAQADIADVASSSSPGTLFTVPWASAGLSTLAWGTGYQYQLRGRDTSAQWSDWSAKRSFSTNAAPSVPSNLQPANNAPLTSYPLLTCTATDADDTDGSGLAVFARIKDVDGEVLQTRAMTLVSGAWRYQTTGSDLPGYGIYRWDAYSHDGTLYSGEQAIEANAVKSSQATFVFATGPTVVITNPAPNGTITTASTTVTWETTGQQRYRVTITDNETHALIYDSGIRAGSAGEHVVPTGYLRNNTAYRLVVWVENSAPLEGQSPAIWFDVQYPPVDPVSNVQAEPILVGTDLWPSAVRITYDQTEYGSGEGWQEYCISHWTGSGQDIETVLIRDSSPLSVAFEHYLPRSGVEHYYAVTQSVMVGLDVLTSDPVIVSARIDLGGVVLCSVIDPVALRTTLRYTNDRDYPRRIVEQPYYPLSGRLPTTVRARTRVREPEFDAQLFADRVASAATRRSELEALDASGDTLCYRDDKGRLLFCTMPTCTPTDHVPGWYTARIGLREERFDEGVD